MIGGLPAIERTLRQRQLLLRGLVHRVQQGDLLQDRRDAFLEHRAERLAAVRVHTPQVLGVRTGVDDVKSLAAILIQADRFGSSVAQALRVQSDSMRIKRRQIAEEKAAKTAVQMIFPLVLFIFPGIFVVLVGPAAVAIYQRLLKK